MLVVPDGVAVRLVGADGGVLSSAQKRANPPNQSAAALPEYAPRTRSPPTQRQPRLSRSMAHTPSPYAPLSDDGYQVGSYVKVAASHWPTRLMGLTERKPAGFSKLFVPSMTQLPQWQPM